METCVLIPQEFALAATAAGARHSAEQQVSVWSTRYIQKGTLCYPFQGTVRIDKLDIYSYVKDEDVSISSPPLLQNLRRKYFNFISCI